MTFTAPPPRLNTTHGLPASPTDGRALLDSREALARRHPLGAVAAREAQAAMAATLVAKTHRLQNRGDQGGGPVERSGGFGATSVPPGLFGGASMRGAPL